MRHERKVVAERGTTRTRPNSPSVAAHTYDPTLTDVLGLEDVGACFPTPSPTTRPATRCTYRQGRQSPYRLLRAVGLTLVDLPDAEVCCVSVAPSP